MAGGDGDAEPIADKILEALTTVGGRTIQSNLELEQGEEMFDVSLAETGEGCFVAIPAGQLQAFRKELSDTYPLMSVSSRTVEGYTTAELLHGENRPPRYSSQR